MKNFTRFTRKIFIFKREKDFINLPPPPETGKPDTKKNFKNLPKTFFSIFFCLNFLWTLWSWSIKMSFDFIISRNETFLLFFFAMVDWEFLRFTVAKANNATQLSPLTPPKTQTKNFLSFVDCKAFTCISKINRFSPFFMFRRCLEFWLLMIENSHENSALTLFSPATKAESDKFE